MADGDPMHPTTLKYLEPTDEQAAKMERVRAAAKAYADVLKAELPEGPTKTYILRIHRSNAMWINVGLADGPDDDDEHPHGPLMADRR